MSFDLDRAQALESRRVLFDRAAARDALVLAFHLHPFRSLGYVQKKTGTSRFREQRRGV
jgi:hypothetical protein